MKGKIMDTFIISLLTFAVVAGALTFGSAVYVSRKNKKRK
jgi:hypothetical protein